jgi:hypothetical protein
MTVIGALSSFRKRARRLRPWRQGPSPCIPPTPQFDGKKFVIEKQEETPPQKPDAVWRWVAVSWLQSDLEAKV